MPERKLTLSLWLQKMAVGVGLEPTRPEGSPDLQSGPINLSGTLPLFIFSILLVHGLFSQFLFVLGKFESESFFEPRPQIALPLIRWRQVIHSRLVGAFIPNHQLSGLFESFQNRVNARQRILITFQSEPALFQPVAHIYWREHKSGFKDSANRIRETNVWADVFLKKVWILFTRINIAKTAQTIGSFSKGADSGNDFLKPIFQPFSFLKRFSEIGKR